MIKESTEVNTMTRQTKQMRFPVIDVAHAQKQENINVTIERFLVTTAQRIK